MSLYNMLFGVNPAAPILLAMLDTTQDKIPRFRDIYIKDEYIVIHTRTGGGNREYYESRESRISAGENIGCSSHLNEDLR